MSVHAKMMTVHTTVLKGLHRSLFVIWGWGGRVSQSWKQRVGKRMTLDRGPRLSKNNLIVSDSPLGRSVEIYDTVIIYKWMSNSVFTRL